MNLKNRVQLIGNLGKDPIARTFENGNKMTRFSLATSDVYKKNDSFIKDTQWHKIVAWGKVAEIVEKNLTAGSEVVIDGYLSQRTYTDNNGTKQYVTEVVANSVVFRNNPKISEKEKNINQQSA